MNARTKKDLRKERTLQTPTHLAHVEARPAHANFFHNVSAVAEHVAHVAPAAQAVVHAPIEDTILRSEGEQNEC